jgi:hypothetical protein
MARVLSLVGSTLPSNLMPAARGNDAGHWEAQEVADLNDTILAELDSAWNDPLGPQGSRRRKPSLKKYAQRARDVIVRNYGDADLIVLKEPRSSVLVDLWRDALKTCGFETSYIIMLRHPLEVAASLQRRDGLVRNQSLLLWATYMLACERDTRGQNRIFVRYDDLLARGEAVVDRIEETLNIEFPRRSWQASVEIEAFLSEEHRHHAVPAEDRTLSRFPEVDQFYGYLDALARDEPWNVDAAGSLDAWLGSLGQYVGPIFKTFERDLREQSGALQAERHASAEAARALEAAAALVVELEAQLSAAHGEVSAAQERVGRTAAEAEAVAAQASELEAALLAAEQRKAELGTEVVAVREEVARSLAEFKQRASDAHSAAMAREEALSAEVVAVQRHVEELEADVVRLRAEHDAALQAESIVAARANRELKAAETELNRVTRALAAQEREASERAAQIARDAAIREAALQADVERGRAELRVAQEQSEALARELLSTISNQRRRPWWALRRQ